MGNDTMLVGTKFYSEFRRTLRRTVWDDMMANHIEGWCSFFRMIERDEARLMIAENSRVPRLPTPGSAYVG